MLKYRKIQSVLADRIQRGMYAQGLPGERILADEFQVARVTIRSALSGLEDTGMINRHQRRGTSVAASNHENARRRLLREHVDKFLDRGRADHRKVLRLVRVPASSTVANWLKVPLGELVYRIVRVRSDDQAPLTYTESFVPVSVGHALTRAGLERQALVQILEDSGCRISSAEQQFSCMPAPAEAAQALQIAEGSPIWKIHRLLLDPQGQPIQLLIGWYRADRFEIKMQLSREEDATKVWLDYH